MQPNRHGLKCQRYQHCLTFQPPVPFSDWQPASNQLHIYFLRV